MGKKNFTQIYKDCKKQCGGKISIKISYYSDNFDKNKDFGGCIIYKRSGKCQWKNTAGLLKGHNGRSFYVIIQKTNGWDIEQKGTGKLHPHIIENHMGIARSDQEKIFCGGGFAYHEKKLKYHSWWLNSGLCCNASYESDKNLDMSTKEKVLIQFIFNEWKKRGSHIIIQIPKWLDEYLSK